MVEYLTDIVERLTTQGNALLIYLAVINVVTFFLFGFDKWKAKQSKWRIPEATLLGMAVIGGSIGAWLGMKVWHHKTLHKKFRYGVPLILVAQIVLCLFCACGTSSVSQRSTNKIEQNSISATSDKVWGVTPANGKVAEIIKRDTLLVGTTGDYRPLSFREDDGSYWGFGIEIAKEIAKGLGVETAFVKTSWPTLTEDVLAKPQLFDLAIGGITITDARKETMLMSEGYLSNGKTILCRASDVDRFQSLTDIDKSDVRVMVNPGGLNEQFANDNLTHATIIVHQKNEEIPSLVAEGAADVMITEITEAPYYVQTDARLAAPLMSKPFTHSEIGVLMQKGREDLLQVVNNAIQRMKEDGTLRQLLEKYGMIQ